MVNIIIVFVFIVSVSSAATPSKILILPLTIHSEKDLSFLQHGIEDMLFTRLALEGKTSLINREQVRKALDQTPGPINEQTALLMGDKLQADYVLFGSLTIFGNSISANCRFVDVHQKKPVVIFYRSGKSRDDIPEHINIFAAQINETVFGHETLAYKPDLQPSPGAGVLDDIKPPKLPPTPESLPSADAQTVAEEPAKTTFSLWKSRNFKERIRGVAVGDVDGDGRNETVFISSQDIFIYRFNNKIFEKVAEINGKGANAYLGVDIADVNNNGKSEIFITNFPSGNAYRLMSFVLEWEGVKFKKITDNEKWYYRTLNTPARGRIIIGQKQGIEDLFFPGIHELKWNDGRYESAGRLDLPKRTNIFGFTSGDVFNDGREMILSFTKGEQIRIHDHKGNEVWTSIEQYGGSPVYIEFPSESDPKEEDYIYLFQRIHVKDIDKDGKNEVIVVKNSVKIGRVFKRLRAFGSGRVECLAWEDFGLYPKWKTRDVSKYISDCVIADFDNDGNDEVVFSVVAKTSMISKNDRSFIGSLNIP
jgi:hypothetical protein